MCFNGSKCLNGTKVGITFISPEGKVLQYVEHFNFDATNNMPKYVALLLKLHRTKAMRIHCLLIQGDYQLVVNQMDKFNPYLDDEGRGAFWWSCLNWPEPQVKHLTHRGKERPKRWSDNSPT